MPKTRDEDKIQQVMKFLMSFRRPSIAVLALLRGFDEDERQKGFGLVDKAAGRHLAMDSAAQFVAGPDKGLITAIDAIENTWYDVIDAGLFRLFPVVHAKVFKNLKKTSGVMVVINVKTLLERITALETSSDANEKAAFAEIERRGFDKEQRDYAQSLVDRAYKETADPSEAPSIPSPEDEKQLAAAMNEMWAWYIDWSKTLRTVVNDKRLRIIMGISSPTRHSGQPEDEEGEEPVGDTPRGGGTAEQ